MHGVVCPLRSDDSMDLQKAPLNRSSVEQSRPWLRDPSLLLTAVVTAGLIVLFLALANAVVDEESTRFDRQLLLSLRQEGQPDQPIGPLWLREVARDITALGSWSIVSLVTLFAIGFLFLQHRRRTALLLVVAIGGGWLASSLLKLAFARPRPDVIPHFVETLTHSFPSGHSMLSAVTYLTYGALASQLVSRRIVKLYLVGACITVALLVGLTRVYLGVHYPTDVLAGWALGFAWGMLCLLVTRLLIERGTLRKPPEETTKAVAGDAEAPGAARRLELGQEP